MTYGCRACSNNCYIPGKVRGTKIRNFTCPCGGALRKGLNAEGASHAAVPLKLEEQGVREERLGLKRSTSRPQARGAARLELVVLMVILGPLVAAGLVYGAFRLYQWWFLSIPRAVICDRCEHLLEEGLEPPVLGRCLACSYAVKQGLA